MGAPFANSYTSVPVEVWIHKICSCVNVFQIRMLCYTCKYFYVNIYPRLNDHRWHADELRLRANSQNPFATQLGCDTNNPRKRMPTGVLEACASAVTERYRRVVRDCATGPTIDGIEKYVRLLCCARAQVLQDVCGFLNLSPNMSGLPHGDTGRAFLNTAHRMFKQFVQLGVDVNRLQRQTRKHQCGICYAGREKCFDCRTTGRLHARMLDRDELLFVQSMLIGDIERVNAQLDERFGMAWRTLSVITAHDFDPALRVVPYACWQP